MGLTQADNIYRNRSWEPRKLIQVIKATVSFSTICFMIPSILKKIYNDELSLALFFGSDGLIDALQANVSR